MIFIWIENEKKNLRAQNNLVHNNMVNIIIVMSVKILLQWHVTFLSQIKI